MDCIKTSVRCFGFGDIHPQITSHKHKHYRPVTEETWSRQHHKIRTPRPLVDEFDLGTIHKRKEWWRERRIAPETYMGFPDVRNIDLRGGPLHAEKMNASVLSIITNKVVEDGIRSPDVLQKLCWRAQQLATKTTQPELCYFFQNFARADWYDQYFVTTVLGNIYRRLPSFELRTNFSNIFIRFQRFSV